MALIVEQKTCVRRFYVNLGLDVWGSVQQLHTKKNAANGNNRPRPLQRMFYLRSFKKKQETAHLSSLKSTPSMMRSVGTAVLSVTFASFGQ